MKLNELLSIINKVGNKISSQPYICGGVPRNKLLKIYEIKDVDITTCDNSINKLSLEVAKYLKSDDVKYTVSNDGHSTIIYKKYKIDFSSNFISPMAKPVLQKMGISNPNKYQLEMYSRDFTINSFLMTMDMKKIADITKRGIKDLNDRKINTCLPASITLKDDPRRVLRAINLSSKFGLTISDNIYNWVKANQNLVLGINSGYATKVLNTALSNNKQNTIKILNDMGIYSILGRL